MGCGTSGEFYKGKSIIKIIVNIQNINDEQQEHIEKELQILVDISNTIVLELKQLIQQHLFISEKLQVLIFQDKDLLDDQILLKNAGISCNSEIELRYDFKKQQEYEQELDKEKRLELQKKSGRKIQIKIRNQNHETIEVEIGTMAQVFWLKQIIQEKFDIQWLEQNLIFGGQFMEDQKILKDYGVRNQYTVLLRKKQKPKK